MKSVDYRVKPAHCPKCGGLLDAAMSLTSENRPRTGDLTVCIYCGAALKFLLSGDLEKISDDELVNIALDSPAAFKLLLRTQKAMEALRQMKGQDERSSNTVD